MKVSLKCVKVVEFLWVHEGPVSKNTTLPIDVKVAMKLQNMLCSHATPHAYIYVRMLCHMNDRSFSCC